MHATGFCAGVWDPVVEELTATGIGFDAISLDQRGHGRSIPLSYPLDWWQLGRDVLGAAAGSDELIGVGHSSGGAALIMAELLAPGTFRRLVLIEPIIPEPPFGRQEDHPLATGALRRRRRFADHDAVVAAYRGRGPFVGWDERALVGYVSGALEPAPEGGVQLACSPEDEAEFYRSAYVHGAWERLGELAVAVDLVIGRDSDTHPAPHVARLEARIPLADVVWIEDADHFVPMQQPKAIAQLVARAIEYEKPEQQL
jgi:pimeloyl-ACP methyl ester carboxylesterase